MLGVLEKKRPGGWTTAAAGNTGNTQDDSGPATETQASPDAPRFINSVARKALGPLCGRPGCSCLRELNPDCRGWNGPDYPDGPTSSAQQPPATRPARAPRAQAADREPITNGPAEAFVQEWDNFGRRFCSAAYHAPRAAWDLYAAGTVKAEHFPRRELFNLWEIIATATRFNALPLTARHIFCVAHVIEDAELSIGSDNPEDVVGWLPFLECTAAGLQNYAARLAAFGRQRAQAARLWARYVDCLTLPKSRLRRSA